MKGTCNNVCPDNNQNIVAIIQLYHCKMITLKWKIYMPIFVFVHILVTRSLPMLYIQYYARICGRWSRWKIQTYFYFTHSNISSKHRYPLLLANKIILSSPCVVFWWQTMQSPLKDTLITKQIYSVLVIYM